MDLDDPIRVLEVAPAEEPVPMTVPEELPDVVPDEEEVPA